MAWAHSEVMGSAAFWLGPSNLLSLVSYSTQNHQHMGGTTHGELRPPTSVIKQENAAQVCPHTTQSGGGIFSIEVFSSTMTLTCKVETSQYNWSLLTGSNPVPWRSRQLVPQRKPNSQDSLVSMCLWVGAVQWAGMCYSVVGGLSVLCQCLGQGLLSLPHGLLAAIRGQKYLCGMKHHMCALYSLCLSGKVLDMPRASPASVTPTLFSPDQATHCDSSKVHLWQAHPGQAGEILHEEWRGLGAHLWSP